MISCVHNVWSGNAVVRDDFPLARERPMTFWVKATPTASIYHHQRRQIVRGKKNERTFHGEKENWR